MVKRKAPARGGIPVINLTRVAQKATAAEMVEFVEPPLSLKNRLIRELRAAKARRCDALGAAGSAAPFERDATIISLVDNSEEEDEVRVKDEPGVGTRAEQHCIYWWCRARITPPELALVDTSPLTHPTRSRPECKAVARNCPHCNHPQDRAPFTWDSVTDLSDKLFVDYVTNSVHAAVPEATTSSSWATDSIRDRQQIIREAEAAATRAAEAAAASLYVAPQTRTTVHAAQPKRRRVRFSEGEGVHKEYLVDRQLR